MPKRILAFFSEINKLKIKYEVMKFNSLLTSELNKLP